jgi:hypothetical protein
MYLSQMTNNQLMSFLVLLLLRLSRAYTLAMTRQIDNKPSGRIVIRLLFIVENGGSKKLNIA